MKINFFREKTIKARLIRYNFVIISVIAAFVSMCSYVTASRKTVQLARNSLEYQVSSISYRYQMAYEEMINIILSCTERETFDLSELGDYSTVKAKKKGLDYVKLIGHFCAITGYGSYINKLSVFNDSGVLIQSGTSLGSNNDYERIRYAPWFHFELEKTMEYYQFDLVESPFYQDKGQVLPIARELSGKGQGNEGWVLLCLSTKLFQDELQEVGKGQEVVVVTAAGQRIAAVNEKEEDREENNAIIKGLLEEKKIKGLMEKRIHGRDSLIAYEKYGRSGILVYSNISMRSIKNDKLMLVWTVSVMFGACLLIGLILSIIFTHQVNKPIKHLVHHIETIAEGNFKQNISIETEDEIGTIGRVVNEMTGQIEHLMEQRLEDEKEKSDLELKMLQAQINPHFLYNTLDSIKWIAVIQKNSGIVKVVTALSSLLRNMAKGFHEKVTLRKELDFVQDYVTIEKVKYVELFDLHILVEDSGLYEAKVIKLTLQPLVENAIFSGIEPNGKNGTIEIHVFTQHGNLVITVTDNGKGIPREQLKTILTEPERVKSHRMSGIGLPNVDRRIKLTYGESYGLSIESEADCYTKVIVTMPLEY